MTRFKMAKQSKGVWDIVKAQDGPWMLFEDHERVTAEQRQEIARLREALELYKRASYQSHTGHWDKTGGGGSGCPACLEARDLRNQAEQALKEHP